jgi:hypothetical protein
MVGDDTPHLRDRGRGIDWGDVRGYGVLFHKILPQVEASLGISLTYFEKRYHHPIDFKKELMDVRIYSKTVKTFSSGDHIVRSSDL